MMQFAVTGRPPAPMPSRISAWGVYDVFTVQGGEQIFLAAVSDTQWALLCDEFGFADLQADPRLASNNDRVRARDWLMPVLRERLAGLHRRRDWPRASRGAACPMRRSRGRRTCSTTRTCSPPAAWHRSRVPADASGAGHAFDTRMPLLPLAHRRPAPAAAPATAGPG